MSTMPGQPFDPRMVYLPRRRRRWVSVVISLALLLSGSAIGAGLTVIVIVRQLQYRIHHPDQVPRLMANRLARRLDLDAQQHQQVEKIICDHQHNLMALRAETQPKLEAELDAIRKDISQILNEDQKARFETWLSTLRRSWLPPVPASHPVAD